MQSGSDTLLQVTVDRITIAVLQNVDAASIITANIRQTISGNGSSHTSPPLPTVFLDAGSVAHAKGVTITGTAGTDRIQGQQSVGTQPLPTLSADTIAGGASDDYIDASPEPTTSTAAPATIRCRLSQRQIEPPGRLGRDVLMLDSTDVIDLSASDLSEGLPIVSGFDEVDGRGSSLPLTTFGNSNNNIWGGSGDNRLAGGGGNDRIDGGDGADLSPSGLDQHGRLCAAASCWAKTCSIGFRSSE